MGNFKGVICIANVPLNWGYIWPLKFAKTRKHQRVPRKHRNAICDAPDWWNRDNAPHWSEGALGKSVQGEIGGCIFCLVSCANILPQFYNIFWVYEVHTYKNTVKLSCPSEIKLTYSRKIPTAFQNTCVGLFGTLSYAVLVYLYFLYLCVWHTGI